MQCINDSAENLDQMSSHDTIDGKHALICQACNKAINPNQKFQMTQHLNTKTHQSKVQNWNKSKQLTLRIGSELIK